MTTYILLIKHIFNSLVPATCSRILYVQVLELPQSNFGGMQEITMVSWFQMYITLVLLLQNLSTLRILSHILHIPFIMLLTEFVENSFGLLVLATTKFTTQCLRCHKYISNDIIDVFMLSHDSHTYINKHIHTHIHTHTYVYKLFFVKSSCLGSIASKY